MTQNFYVRMLEVKLYIVLVTAPCCNLVSERVLQIEIIKPDIQLYSPAKKIIFITRLQQCNNTVRNTNLNSVIMETNCVYWGEGS